MAKDLNALTTNLKPENKAKGMKFRPGGGGVGFKKGDIITLPTVEDFNAERGASIEWIDPNDKERGYYVQVAVRINKGDWEFVPSGTFARALYPVDPQTFKPIEVAWEGEAPTRVLRSDDPFSNRIRRGGDVFDTLAAAVEALGTNQLEVIDAKEVTVLEYMKTDQTRMREAYRYQAHGATTTDEQQELPPEGNNDAK